MIDTAQEKLRKFYETNGVIIMIQNPQEIGHCERILRREKKKKKKKKDRSNY